MPLPGNRDLGLVRVPPVQRCGAVRLGLDPGCCSLFDQLLRPSLLLTGFGGTTDSRGGDDGDVDEISFAEVATDSAQEFNLRLLLGESDTISVDLGWPNLNTAGLWSSDSAPHSSYFLTISCTLVREL